MKTSGIIALDIGTSSIRVTVFEKNSGIKARFTTTQQIGERFSIEKLWTHVEGLIKQAVQAHPAIDIEAIGISAFLGWVIVDDCGSPVEDAWSWMSKANKKEYEKYAPKIPAEAPGWMGRSINDELGVFRWGDSLRVAGENRKLLSVKDYLNFKLTGCMRMDRAHASYTGLCSIRDREWEPRLLEVFEIPREAVPILGDGINEVGTLLESVANKLGISKNVKVPLSGPDGTLAMLGGGGTRSGKTIEVMGTTDVLFHIGAYIEDPELLSSGLIQNCHILPNLYATGGPTGMTGGALSWLMKEWSWTFESQPYKEMLLNWNDIHPASTKLFVIPTLTGARVPDWNPSVRGSFVGIQASHTSADIFKATVEGFAFMTRRILDRLSPFIENKNHFVAIGGGTKEKRFLQTRADASGKTIQLPYEAEASTVGVFALTAYLIKWYETVEMAVADYNPIAKEIIPVQAQVEKYQESFAEYDRFLSLMDTWYRQ
ncbi:xylulokinase [Bacillus litorisediminis]|uniref:xylulokinase n=1 Tax=Bacillus litorisediminis TaxID=2922713 RepID=UPI001FABB183|nr:FGGY-family carbohydrate kinase [Bacillus litorisediminis]